MVQKIERFSFKPTFGMCLVPVDLKNGKGKNNSVVGDIGIVFLGGFCVKMMIGYSKPSYQIDSEGKESITPSINFVFNNDSQNRGPQLIAIGWNSKTYTRFLSLLKIGILHGFPSKILKFQSSFLLFLSKSHRFYLIGKFYLK